MFEKSYETKNNEKFIKFYRSNYNIIDVYNMINLEKFTISKIKISEDADLGLKAFGGEYDITQFEEVFNKYFPFIKDITVYFSNIPCSLTVFDDGSVSLISSGINIEINNIILEKNKKKV